MPAALDRDAEAAIARLRRAYGVDAEVLATLRAFHPVAAPHFPRLAREFYERIREHTGAHDVITGERQIERLQRSMVRWLERLFLSPRDAEHVAEALRVARRHVEVGLPERYVLVATTLLRIGLARVADVLAPGKATTIRDAIARALDLELALAVETYQELTAARIRRLEGRSLDVPLARDRAVHARAVERSPFLVVGLDAHASITFLNAVAAAAIGREPEAVSGLPFAEIFLGRDRARASEVLRGSAPTLAILPTDRTRVLRWSLVRVDDGLDHEGDEQLAWVAFGRDVTDEEREAGHALRAERRSAEVTLATGLAHEIRNPLNGARLHARLLERSLRDGGADPDASLGEGATMLADELRRLAELLDQFLEVVRPTPLTLEDVALDDVCRRAMDAARPRLERSSATLRLEVAPVPRVRLDVGRVTQALSAMIENAADAVEGRPQGSIVLRAHLAAAPYVTFEVEDDGHGLPFPDAPVVDAFWTTKRGAKGLGLTLACRVATDHGGSLSVVRPASPTVVRMLVADAP